MQGIEGAGIVVADRYDVDLIDNHIRVVHSEIGDGPFLSLGLMALEQIVRGKATGVIMPGKTLLRERLNRYRTARWPSLAPKKVPRYW